MSSTPETNDEHIPLEGDGHVAAPARKSKPRKEPIGLRVARSGADILYSPATASDATRILSAKHAHGDLVFVDFRKPRNPGFHRLAHAIGKLAVENIEEFSHLEAHSALKRLQVESGAGCDVMAVEMRTFWKPVAAWIEENLGSAATTVLNLFFRNATITNQLVSIRVPKSLSFDSMDEGEFQETVKSICTYMAKRYWPSLSPEEIEKMADATKDLTT